MAKTIELTRGCVAIVDDEDYERVAAHRWHAMRCKGKWFYAMRRGSRPRGEPRNVFLHWVIAGRPPKGMAIDHIDGDGLNNTRANLRFCTPGQNTWNTRAHKDSTSKYKGVCRPTGRRKWHANICIGGKNLFLGAFDQEEDAARAYNGAARAAFGEFARLNPVD